MSLWVVCMIVNIIDYGDRDGKNFITYEVLDLLPEQINYLHAELIEETSIKEDVLEIMMYFEPELYPFQSDAAKIRMDDFIAREEIELNIFLSSFIEDM